MENEQLAQHISNKLWINKNKIVEVLEEFMEEPPAQQSINTVLTADDLVVGKKYIPIRKSVGCRTKESYFIKEELTFLYYNGKSGRGDYYFGFSKGDLLGDFYLPSDVIEYIEPPAKNK